MFELPKLPFAQDALEPLMSSDTLGTHYGKHHAAYVKKLNALLAEYRGDTSSLEKIVHDVDPKANAPLFNNAAQAWNHAFFWNSLTPKSEGPGDGLAKAIERDFKSLDKFREQFVKEGEGHFGSGWVWLTADHEGELTIESMHDAMTPIANGRTPILVCDVWEHAYYLDHKNERGAFLKVVTEKLFNWSFAEKQYAAALGQAEPWRYPAPTQDAPQAKAS